MEVYWERVLGPIYRLVGQGFNDQEIAEELNITETDVRGCVLRILKSFGISDRLELVRHAFSTESLRTPGPQDEQEHTAPRMTISEIGIADDGAATGIPSPSSINS